MANNYVLLSSTVLQSTVSSVTFSNLPTSGYTNLKIYVSARSTRSNPTDTFFIKLNGDYNTALYDYTQLYGYGNGGLVGTGSSTIAALFAIIPSATMTANYFGALEVEVFGYTASEFKPVRISDAAMGDANNNWQIDDVSMLYKNNSPITSIVFSGDVGNLVAGSTIAVYGLANANQTPSSPKAAGGNIVTSDGTYWYHTFLSSGTFTPTVALSCDYLVVAGGGSGGGIGAGGGAGGYRSTVTATGGGGSLETPISVMAQAYTVTVGAGGAGVSGTSNGSKGSDSVFASITSNGGGGGGGYNKNAPTGTLGSGGGGGYNDSGSAGTTYAGASGTAGQGFAGGNAPGPTARAAGGGGAGAVGGNSSSASGGNGGAGVASSITGTSVTRGGGGGGAGAGASFPAGTGGSGGGGNGANETNNPTPGSANTGGGGGGAYNGGSGNNGQSLLGNGGSGIVIVRYAV